MFIFNSAASLTSMLANQAPSSFDVYCGQALFDGLACTRTSNRLTVDFVAPAVGTTGGDGMRGVCLDYRQLPC